MGQAGFESDWSSPCAYANFSGWDNIVYGTDNEPIKKEYDNISIEMDIPQNSNSIWLSDAYGRLRESHTKLPPYPTLDHSEYIFIICEFEIDSNATVNHVAYTDKREVNSNELTSPYNASGAFKGISNTYYEIESDFDYTIDGNEYDAKDGNLYIPIRVFNLSNPLGYKANYWETNANPQQDPYSVNIEGAGYEWVRDIATETNLLMFQYKDVNKKYRYGDSIPDEQREDIWYFDQFHKNLDGIPPTGIEPKYMPNQLSQAIDFESQIGMANYSVLQTYNVHFKNDTNKDKTVKFYLNSSGSALVRNENLVDSSVEIKEKKFSEENQGEPEEEWMATMIVPAYGEVNYKLSVVLVTASTGSIRNFFRVE